MSTGTYLDYLEDPEEGQDDDRMVVLPSARPKPKAHGSDPVVEAFFTRERDRREQEQARRLLPRPVRPAPEVTSRQALAAEIPQGANAVLKLLTKAGWRAWATYARGPVGADGSSRCPRCGKWTMVAKNGLLRSHGPIIPQQRQAEEGRPKTVRVCSDVTPDPDSPPWQIIDSIVVRGQSPSGWWVGVAYEKLDTGWSNADAQILIRGDRPRSIQVSKLSSVLREIIAA